MILHYWMAYTSPLINYQVMFKPFKPLEEVAALIKYRRFVGGWMRSML